MDSYIYDPNNPTVHSGVLYNWAEGAFKYISGKIGPAKSESNIQTGFGTIGIRGTEFVATINPTGDGAEADLIEGQLDIAPKLAGRHILFSAPVRITFSGAGATGSPLSEQQYDAAKERLSPAPAPSFPLL